MTKNAAGPQPADESGHHALRLPGFINEDDVGLGDVIKSVTTALHVRPCGGCERRAGALNRRLVFTGGHRSARTRG